MINSLDKNKNLTIMVARLAESIKSRNLIVNGIRDIQYGKQIHIESLEGDTLIVNVYLGKNDFSFVANNKTSILYWKVLECIEEQRVVADMQFSNYIGTDESGKGDYFGPLVVAGFVTNREINHVLYDMGVKDSKRLDDFSVYEIANKIMDRFSKHLSICSIEPEKYNELYSYLRLQGKKMNHLLAWGHARVIENLITNHNELEGVIADQFGDTAYLEKSLFEKGKQLRIVQMKNAEYDMAVAAASILARYEFLKWIEKTSKYYNINLCKGAGEEAKKTALNVALDVGLKELRKLVKLHFKTTKDVLAYYHSIVK